MSTRMPSWMPARTSEGQLTARAQARRKLRTTLASTGRPASSAAPAYSAASWPVRRACQMPSPLRGSTKLPASPHTSRPGAPPGGQGAGISGRAQLRTGPAGVGVGEAVGVAGEEIFSSERSWPPRLW
jgi:hypothetical protein